MRFQLDELDRANLDDFDPAALENELKLLRGAEKIHGATLQGLGGSKKRGSKIANVEVGVDKWAGKFGELPLYGTEHSQAFGIIGQDLLKKCRVVIDYGSMKVELTRHLALFGGGS